MNKPCHRHRQFLSSDLESLQKRIKALPEEKRLAFESAWKTFQDSSTTEKNLFIDGLVNKSCFDQLLHIQRISLPLTHIDFLAEVATETSMEILKYLDAKSLCRASIVSKAWNKLCDDNILWHRLCFQHIDRQCTQCGWGLPLMHPKVVTPSRPWKDIYAERQILEQNWRRPAYADYKLTGHQKPVMSMMYDSKTSTLISAGLDNKLMAWNLDTKECIAVMEGHTRGIRDVQFDNSKIVSCSMDATVRIWCRKTWAQKRVIAASSGVVCISFNESILTYGCINGTIRVMLLREQTSFTLEGHADWVNTVKILPSKDKILSASDDQNIKLWSLESRSCIALYTGHQGPVQGLALLPLNEHGQLAFASCSLDNTIKIWDFANTKVIQTWFGHEDGVWDISADSLRLVSASRDEKIGVWDIKKGKLMYDITNSGGSVNCCKLSDVYLFSGHEDGSITVRDFS